MNAVGSMSMAAQGEAPAAPPLYRIENLALHYGNRPALRDVSLAINAGRITALIGPSGCGKTSLLMCLARLTDHAPRARVSGHVWLDGEALYGRQIDESTLRRRVGLVFQKPTPFPFSIQKNIELPLREHGMRDKAELAARTEKVLRDVGLWNEVRDRLQHSALSLSGGQQQRLCIARALALEPRVLLMDEPCSALDPLASAVVEELIDALGTRYSVVLVTHNLAQARRIADDAALFWTSDGVGQLVEHGSVDELFQTPHHPLTAAYTSGARG